MTAPPVDHEIGGWADTGQRVLMRRGAIGQIRRGRLAFAAEVRSLAHVLGQTVGRTFQATCDAALGDVRCGVDLDDAAFRGTGSVTALVGDRGFTASGLGSFANGWLALGTLDWTSGEAWNLLPIDARSALLAESYDIMLVSGGKAQALTGGAAYPRLLRRASADPDVALAGLTPGIAVLRRAGGAWKVVLEDHSETELEVSTMVEAAAKLRRREQ